MKLVVGLGNPSEKYRNTRHNVGFFVVKKLKEKNKKNILVFKSDSFMNDSGTSVKKLVDKYKINPSNLYIVHDDLDIKLGEHKIQFGKGPKVHNGLNDIYEKLGTKEFWHVRIGVENRDPENRTKGEQYVLEDFKNDERFIVDKVIIEVCKKLEIS